MNESPNWTADGTGSALASQPRTGASSDPVFVLCAGRSGSTLLRFLLDAHPDLACPPETNVPALCGQLATVWSLIEGAPLSQNRGDEPPDIPDAAIAGVRETMDRMVGSYLTRRGKKRYCDKSLGTARFAYLMTRVWPTAKFICLYRHPMDVIASGMEACPWGLNGYGFDGYIAETPGNAVWALARFWADNAETVLAAEKEYADRCHRVRYEDMVTDTQATADGIYEFLGVAPTPDIHERIFAADRERFGPADYKIWHTSRISGDSVGRGWTVPSGLIAPPTLARVSELASQLGYVPVDETWGTADRPADLRADAVTPATPARQAGAEVPRVAEIIGERLTGRLSRLTDGFANRWQPCAADTFQLVITPDTAGGAGPDARWEVDLAAAAVTAVSPEPLRPASDDKPPEVVADDEDDGGWCVIGSAVTWRQVAEGSLNMSVAMRHNLLRYCDDTSAGPVTAEARIAMLADLLSLTSWGQVNRSSSRNQPEQEHRHD
jgi:hypothetical protein